MNIPPPSGTKGTDLFQAAIGLRWKREKQSDKHPSLCLLENHMLDEIIAESEANLVLVSVPDCIETT
jgi:hypothetical protein